MCIVPLFSLMYWCISALTFIILLLSCLSKLCFLFHFQMNLSPSFQSYTHFFYLKIDYLLFFYFTNICNFFFQSKVTTLFTLPLFKQLIINLSSLFLIMFLLFIDLSLIKGRKIVWFKVSILSFFRLLDKNLWKSLICYFSFDTTPATVLLFRPMLSFTSITFFLRRAFIFYQFKVDLRKVSCFRISISLSSCIVMLCTPEVSCIISWIILFSTTLISWSFIWEMIIQMPVLNDYPLFFEVSFRVSCSGHTTRIMPINISSSSLWKSPKWFINYCLKLLFWMV